MSWNVNIRKKQWNLKKSLSRATFFMTGLTADGWKFCWGGMIFNAHKLELGANWKIRKYLFSRQIIGIVNFCGLLRSQHMAYLSRKKDKFCSIVFNSRYTFLKVKVSLQNLNFNNSKLVQDLDAILSADMNSVLRLN